MSHMHAINRAAQLAVSISIRTSVVAKLEAISDAQMAREPNIVSR